MELGEKYFFFNFFNLHFHNMRLINWKKFPYKLIKQKTFFTFQKKIEIVYVFKKRKKQKTIISTYNKN